PRRRPRQAKMGRGDPRPRVSVAALVAERRGDLVGGEAELVDPLVLDELGGRRDRQAGDQAARVVADTGGDAADTGFEFFIVAGVAAGAHERELALELRGLGDAVARVPREAGPH